MYIHTIHHSTYRDSFPLHLVIFQLRERSIRVLPPVHTYKSATSRRDQVDAHDIAEFTERVGQLLLMHEFRQVSNPQCRTANCKKARGGTLQFLTIGISYWRIRRFLQPRANTYRSVYPSLSVAGRVCVAPSPSLAPPRSSSPDCRRAFYHEPCPLSETYNLKIVESVNVEYSSDRPIDPTQ